MLYSACFFDHFVDIALLLFLTLLHLGIGLIVIFAGLISFSSGYSITFDANNVCVCILSELLLQSVSSVIKSTLGSELMSVLYDFIAVLRLAQQRKYLGICFRVESLPRYSP